MLKLYDKGPCCDHFNSCFLNNITHVNKTRPIFFFNAIDLLKVKYIDPFVNNFHEYKMNQISDISFLFYRLFDCCSFIPKFSSLYTNEIEIKPIKILSIFDSIFQKDNMNDCLILFLINSFIFFYCSSFRTRFQASEKQSNFG